MGQKVFIGSSENMTEAPPGWIWFKPVAGGLEIRELDGGVWTLKETVALVGEGGAHDLGGASHNADTLANLNTKVSDATLINTGDSRLSDARTPTAHKASHKGGGSDPIDVVGAANGLMSSADKTKLDGIDTGAKDDQTGAEIKTAYEAEANAYTDTKDTKLAGIATGADVTGSNAPQTHAASHLSAGGDAVKLDDLASPDDNTDLDFSTTKHGLTPKGTNTGKFLKDDGTWGTPSGGGGGSDVKCGSESVADGASQAVTFTTAFSSTPQVVACFGDNQAAVDIVEVGGVSTTGFTIYIKKGHGGGNHTHVVNWIATDAGDP